MQHMAGSTVFLDTSLLPANLTSLQDAEFYHFVKRIVGPVEAELLQVQQINNVNSLLMTADVFEIIQIPSHDLDDIKRKICFEKDDESFVIKAGVKGNIDYLIELLRAKNNADKRSKILRATLALPSTGLPNAGNTSIPVCSNATATNAIPSLTLAWTLTDHEKFITDSIQRWCDDNKENFKSNDFSLSDGKQYRLVVKSDSNGTFNADIRCDCGKLFVLTKLRGKFQISNYYRHLKAVRPCKVIKHVKDSDQLPVPSNNTQSTSIDVSPSMQNNATSASSISTSSSGNLLLIR